MKKEQTSKPRIMWIDVCRVLFMFIVVFGHSTDILPHHANMGAMRVLNLPFYSYSYPCGIVLMFYFFSGMLNKTKAHWLDWKKYWLFMVPTIMWNVVCMAIKQDWPGTAMGWAGGIGLVPDYKALISTIGSPSDYPLWFMTFLAYYSLVFPSLKRISWRVLVVAVFFLFTCASIYARAHPQDGLDYYILREAQTFGTYLLGVLAAKLGVWRITEWLSKYAWIIVAILLPFSFWHFLPFYHPLFTNGFSSVAGVMALCAYGSLVSKCFPKISGWIVQWAPAVFFIYASHVPFFLLLKKSVDLPELPAHAFYIHALLCYIVGILIFSCFKTNVKWIERYLFMKK